MNCLRPARRWCLMMVLVGAATMSVASIPSVAVAAPEKKANRSGKVTVSKRAVKPVVKAKARSRIKVRAVRTPKLKKSYAVIAPRASAAQLQGLDDVSDALSLQSSVALVVDQESSAVLFAKNPGVALPIASITKLMTALVVLEAKQPLDEYLEINKEDLDTEKGTGSRLAFGTSLTRGDLLHLALMSSENRAANALGRNYPGGLAAFVRAMNAKAQLLGMHSSRFVDPTGLSSSNVASAEDLARLVAAASDNPAIRSYSTGHGYSVQVAGGRTVSYRNTNALVKNPAWDIALQKTGYIREAGRCLVMNTIIGGKAVVIVLLDSVGKYSRLGDADRIKKWMTSSGGALSTKLM